MGTRITAGVVSMSLSAAVMCACGAGVQPAAQVQPARGTPGKVYDGKGQAHDCAPPAESCPASKPDRDLLDKCKLAGYRMARCGCEDYCMGNAAAPKAHYDANGNAKTCEPLKPDCPAVETSATFQDACTDSGHKLVQCGCEWLCSGKFTKAP